MRQAILSVLLMISGGLSAQHTVKTPHITYTVTDTFTVSGCRFFFMQYRKVPYLCVHPFYSTNRFVGVVGDGTNGKKYRAEMVLVNSEGWDILKLRWEDVPTVFRTNQLIIFTDRGPLLLPLKLPMQCRLREQTMIVLKKEMGE